ncbi:tetratricopeptide repeat protein [Lujinxingia vulgaris]|uniref:Tetratricopeptide repeat protein n=1 Tax=Lujinxingia vulgaris TaxID=2600176 RepID=A0A5C6X5N7_9DELT|nr:tetratricopeptide repeat protein [Lujinxingia vulgaris]TXD34947.1 tetratricopeptide repeat protein [Lujinxingia vulgaris]
MSHQPLPRTLLALLLCTAVSACEPSEPVKSPPVTVPGAPKPDAKTPPAAAADEAAEASEDAVESGEESPTRAPAALPPGTPEQQEALMQAKMAFLQNRLVEAEDQFKAIAESEPVTGDTVSAAIALGQIYSETGRRQRALDLYNDLRARVSDLPEVLLVLARTMAELDRPEDAIATYEEALKAQPDYIFLLTELAELHIQQGNQEKAGELLYTYEQRVHTLANRLEDHTTAPEDRLYLVDVFSFVDDDRGYRALIEALNDPHPQVRRAAAITVGELQLDEARNILQRVAIEDEATEVRLAARAALQVMQEQR